MGMIALQGMHFYAKHGYYAHEKQIGTRYTVDVYVHSDLRAAGKGDKLEDTINYESIYEIVKNVMAHSVNLIEHLAYTIIEEIIDTHTDLKKVKVRVTKDNPPLSGDVDCTYVEMERDLRN